MRENQSLAHRRWLTFTYICSLFSELFFFSRDNFSVDFLSQALVKSSLSLYLFLALYHIFFPHLSLSSYISFLLSHPTAIMSITPADMPEDFMPVDRIQGTKKALPNIAFKTTCPPDVPVRSRVVAVCGVTDYKNLAHPEKDGWFFSDFYLFYHLLSLTSKFSNVLRSNLIDWHANHKL
jgi:hypothetical protein